MDSIVPDLSWPGEWMDPLRKEEDSKHITDKTLLQTINAAKSVLYDNVNVAKKNCRVKNRMEKSQHPRTAHQPHAGSTQDSCQVNLLSSVCDHFIFLLQVVSSSRLYMILC